MKRLFALFLFTSLFLSCNPNDDCPANPITCGPSAVFVSEPTFNAVQTNNYTISNMVLNGDCLTVTVSSSGCSADRLSMNLFSTKGFGIFPIQRVAKIELINNDACLAVIQKTATFDLTPFRISGQNTVSITIVGYNQVINYQY